MGDDWSEAEVRLIVADYFEMLQAELLGIAYNKTQHRQRLAPKLNERSSGSIEFKHQNISAVLVNMGLPYIDGYKPRGNFQALLATAVEQYTSDHPRFLDQLAEAKRLNPTKVPMLSVGIGGLFEPPPERIIVPDEITEPWMSRRGKKIDLRAGMPRTDAWRDWASSSSWRSKGSDDSKPGVTTLRQRSSGWLKPSVMALGTTCFLLMRPTTVRNGWR